MNQHFFLTTLAGAPFDARWVIAQGPYSLIQSLPQLRRTISYRQYALVKTDQNES